MTVFWLFLFSMTLTVLRSTGGNVRGIPSLELAWCSSHEKTEAILAIYWGHIIGENTHKGKMLFSSHDVKHTYYESDSSVPMLTLITWLRLLSVRFLHWKITCYPFPTVLSGRKSLRAAHPWAGSYVPLLWGCGMYINYLEFFCTGDLSLLPHYLFNHLFISV